MEYVKIIIHDLEDHELSQMMPTKKEYLTIAANTKAADCVGCFGCWLKTPGKCVLKDTLEYIGSTMAQGKEIIVVSKNCYGGYSPSIKKVFDRGIATSLPFFTYRGGKTHHSCRYKAQPSFTVYFYGEMSDFEKQIAHDLVQANAINMGRRNVKLSFVEDPIRLSEVWQ